MKKFLLIPLAFSLSFCNCSKTVVTNSKTSSIESACPDNGECTIQIFKNKSLLVKKDDLGGIYYQMTDNTDTTVIQYQYNRNVDEGLQDGQHREEIIFEINNSSSEINLEGENIQETKMLFGRYCFCKGQSGCFKVEEGILKVENKNNHITINLDFKINQVPQLFNKVIAIIK
jgi:hypothetical protein